MKNDKWQKRGLSVSFLLLALYIFINSTPITHGESLLCYVKQNLKNLPQSEVTMDTLQEEYVDSLPIKNPLIELNGSVAKTLGMKGFYSDLGMYVLDGSYIISAYPQTSTDYEVTQLVDLQDFLNTHGIKLLYVNLPVKYIDDEKLYRDFGIESYGNQNADLFLQRITEAGIHTLDLRTEIKKDGLDVSDLFFRTDHHWTPDAARWAAEKISQKLNTACGYSIDTSLYNKENFTFTTWEKCWLGEQGRKIAKSYVGLDDYTKVTPKFDTNYSFKYSSELYFATFEHFINESLFDTSSNVYEAASWYYAYNKKNCVNNDVDYGKVLMLGDSYFQVLQPFLSLGIHELDAFSMRERDSSFSLRDYILENEYDTVVICYAQFMIGAHDNPYSSNYRMFDFSR